MRSADPLGAPRVLKYLDWHLKIDGFHIIMWLSGSLLK